MAMPTEIFCEKRGVKMRQGIFDQYECVIAFFRYFSKWETCAFFALQKSYILFNGPSHGLAEGLVLDLLFTYMWCDQAKSI